VVTIGKARKILGKKYEHLTDEEILAIINDINKLSLACADKIEKKIADEGVTFLRDISSWGVK
jgi:hypothetical protein